MNVKVMKSWRTSATEDAEVLHRPMTVGELRAALSEYPDGMLLVTVSGDACAGFVKEVSRTQAAFDYPSCHMGGDAMQRCEYDDDDKARNDAMPEGYWRDALYLSPYPFWNEKTKED